MTAFKVTQKQIRQHIAENRNTMFFVDATNMPYEVLRELVQKCEDSFIEKEGYSNREQLAYSVGTYGISGVVYRVGYYTFAVVGRCSNLYLFV